MLVCFFFSFQRLSCIHECCHCLIDVQDLGFLTQEIPCSGSISTFRVEQYSWAGTLIADVSGAPEVDRKNLVFLRQQVMFNVSEFKPEILKQL